MSGHSVRNCKLCKKPMAYSAFYMCYACLTEIEKVSGYVKHHPYAKRKEIAAGTDLKDDCVQQIVDYFFAGKEIRKK